MIKEERFGKILDLLSKKGKLQYDKTAEALNVSEDTVRRDIDALHNNGLLSKVRGGAISITKNPLTFADRRSFKADKKEIVALKAQRLIQENQTIFMDGGTTNCIVASKLPIDIKLTIITNNLALPTVLSNHKNVELIVLGGLYNPSTQTTEGAKACEEINKYFADLYLLGTCVIDSKNGVTAVFIGDADIKSAMHKNAKKTVALTLKDKLDETESFRVCPMEEISILITELASSDKKLDPYRNKKLMIL
ncbi:MULTISPECIES: DeoR/GlpR family DNA-binding transcription regulator [Flavobacterium]|uniref:DeoR/GlpR family DNA-binding transcription regulator n=1 Tax=Flavobacterium TaxID=237 RepID=UPI001184507B|nr:MULTISPECIES: DeoR/GlpR family DNA-binding transcription regulator [Flavobacterium]MCR4030709.1 DeoR/GlpR family DNA-binding transcription regulator [Flavobacterium panacis]